MIVRWTRPARQELTEIVRFIRQDDRIAASRVAKRILDEAASLENLSERGRHGSVRGTREIVFAPWPYILVYEIRDTQIFILTIRHAAQKWPSQ